MTDWGPPRRAGNPLTDEEREALIEELDEKGRRDGARFRERYPHVANREDRRTRYEEALREWSTPVVVPKRMGPVPMFVTLTDEEIRDAVEAGRRRQHFHDARGTPNRDPNLGYHENELGAIGEAAMLKHRGLPVEVVVVEDDSWRSIESDVDGCQVRAAARSHYRLTSNEPVQRPEQPYVLVRLHDLPVCELAGWVWGYEFEKVGTFGPLRDGDRPCWHVETVDLRAMEELHASAG